MGWSVVEAWSPYSVVYDNTHPPSVIVSRCAAVLLCVDFSWLRVAVCEMVCVLQCDCPGCVL